MRRGLGIYTVAVLVTMLVVTIWASLHESVLHALPRMAADPWTLATFFDTYFGFFWFWLWIAATERSLAAKAGWLVVIFLLGNLAMAIFVAWRLYRAKPEAGLQGFLMGTQ